MMNIIEFAESTTCSTFLLTPVQRVILKAYYGIPLDDSIRYVEVNDMMKTKLLYTMTEKKFMEYLYDEGMSNRKDSCSGHCIGLVASLGRRSGRSLLSAIITGYEAYRLLELKDPVSYYGLPLGSDLNVVSISPSSRQADSISEHTKIQMHNCKEMEDHAYRETMSYVEMKTESGTSLFIASVGSSDRWYKGKNTAALVLNDIAHYKGRHGEDSGYEVFNSVAPSVSVVKGDARLAMISSPYREEGFFHETFERSFEDSDSLLSFNLYSALVNPDHLDSSFLLQMRKGNEENFLNEFGGFFLPDENRYPATNPEVDELKFDI